MGNDPINVTDPSGGLSIDFGTINTLGRIGVAAAGALIGYAADRLSGGKGWKGAVIGGGLALGATFIPPFDIGKIAGLLAGAGATISIVTSVAQNPLVVQNNPNVHFANNSQTAKKSTPWFLTKDEAAFRWGLEYGYLAESGNNERAGVIYSFTMYNLKFYTYNGGFEGGTQMSNYHEDEIPIGSTLEGYIHLHPVQLDFSKPGAFDTRKMPTDQKFMDLHYQDDFYLVNRIGELRVSRGTGKFTSSAQRDESVVMASGLKDGRFKFIIRYWQNSSGGLYSNGTYPRLIKELMRIKR